MTLHVLMSHNLTAPSSLPLTTFFPSGDNAMLLTLLSPSLQSFPICFALFKFHTLSEPSNEQFMIHCPLGWCMTPLVWPECPLNSLQGVIADVSFVLVIKDILQISYFRVQPHPNFHPSNFKTITCEDNNDKVDNKLQWALLLNQSWLHCFPVHHTYLILMFLSLSSLLASSLPPRKTRGHLLWSVLMYPWHLLLLNRKVSCFPYCISELMSPWYGSHETYRPIQLCFCQIYVCILEYICVVHKWPLIPVNLCFEEALMTRLKYSNIIVDNMQ